MARTTRKFLDFTGIDLRRDTGLSFLKSQRVATNLYLTSGKTFRTRPGTELVAELPSTTKGLYSAGGVLRAVAPHANASVYNAQSPLIWFDFVEIAAGSIGEFIDAESYGAHIAQGVKQYVVVRNSATGLVEHYYCTDRPDSAGDSVSNKVTTNFVPTGPITKVAQKVWAINQANGSVNFSSTQFGPTDWTAENDAGFLPVLQHAPGDKELTALSVLGNRLAVFFPDSVQIWGVDAEPLNHYMVASIKGPGTENPKSIQDVFGDLVFFSRGGFRSLHSQMDGLIPETNDIGAEILSLTEDLTAADASVWWGKLGCYLAAFGTDIYVLKVDLENKIRAWTKWVMPWSITDFAVIGPDLYARTTTDAVYRFDPDLTTDSGTAISWELQTPHLHMDNPGVFKSFQSLSLYHTGTATVTVLPDAQAPTISSAVYTVSGTNYAHQKLPIIATSDGVALKFTGTGDWRFSGYAITYTNLRGG